MSGHPLAEMADALAAAADRIDQAIEERAYVTPEVAADAERDSIRLRRTARVLRALHPGVARAALALAGGLKVPDGWSVQMDGRGALVVAGNGNALAVTPYSDGTWTAWRSDRPGAYAACKRSDCPGAYAACKDDAVATPQAAVDAAVEALGGDPCR